MHKNEKKNRKNPSHSVKLRDDVKMSLWSENTWCWNFPAQRVPQTPTTLFWKNLLIYFVLEPHPALLRVYSRLCAQQLLLAMLGELYGLRGSTLGWPHARQVPNLLCYCSAPHPPNANNSWQQRKVYDDIWQSMTHPHLAATVRPSFFLLKLEGQTLD